MVTLYGYTILVGLGLLATVIAIFVFASSFYRGALELSTREEEDSLNRRKKLIKEKRKELIEKARGIDEERLTKELRAELDRFDAELKDIDQSILKSRNKANVLTARNLVAIPGTFLVVSIITSGIAIATSGTLPTVMWILSLASLVTGSYFIYRNLLAVQFFSKSIDLSTLMEQALDKHRMKTTPIVDIEVWDFLLEIEHGETKEISYHVFLKQGSIGRNAKVKFISTEELKFPEEELKPFRIEELQALGIKGKYKGMKKPNEFWHKLGDINPKTYIVQKFKVQAPDQPDEYTMSYWVQCDEYAADEVTFKIKVI